MTSCSTPVQYTPCSRANRHGVDLRVRQQLLRGGVRPCSRSEGVVPVSKVHALGRVPAHHSDKLGAVAFVEGRAALLLAHVSDADDAPPDGHASRGRAAAS